MQFAIVPGGRRPRRLGGVYRWNAAAAAASAGVSCECAVYRNERLFTVIRQPG